MVMEYGHVDTSGTDDDLSLSHNNRVPRGGRFIGNGRTIVGSVPLPMMHRDMESEIHQLEQEALVTEDFRGAAAAAAENAEPKEGDNGSVGGGGRREDTVEISSENSGHATKSRSDDDMDGDGENDDEGEGNGGGRRDRKVGERGLEDGSRWRSTEWCQR